MNKVSILLYLADLAESLKLGAILLLVVGLIIIGLVKYFITMEEVDYKFPQWAFVLLTCAAVVAILVPQGKTVLLIAGSEVGEQVIKTPETKELYDMIFNRIKKELKSTK